MTASPGEDQAGRDSCSLAGRQPAAAWETGQGGVGWGGAGTAPTSPQSEQQSVGAGSSLEARFQAFTLC